MNKAFVIILKQGNKKQFNFFCRAEDEDRARDYALEVYEGYDIIGSYLDYE